MKHGFIKQRSLLTPLLWVSVIVALSSFLERLTPEKFTVDTTASTLVWTGKKVTGSHTGTIKISGGELLVEESNIRQGNFEIDLTKYHVNGRDRSCIEQETYRSFERR